MRNMEEEPSAPSASHAPGDFEGDGFGWHSGQQSFALDRAVVPLAPPPVAGRKTPVTALAVPAEQSTALVLAEKGDKVIDWSGDVGAARIVALMRLVTSGEKKSKL